MRSFAFAAVLAALVLAAPATAGPIPMVVVGDSLSDPYFHYQGANNPATGLPFWGRAGDRNWTEQLGSHYPSGVTFFNYAEAGASTADLIGLPTTKAAIRIEHFGVGRGVVMAGSNDVLDFLNGQLGSDPAAFIAGVAGNLNSILAQLDAAGPVKLVVGNVPDLSAAPTMQALLGGTPGALENLSGLIQALNQQIAGVATAHGAAVVDLFALSHLFDNPVVLAGTTVPPDKIFAPDGFHPGTIPQGLISNALMYAFGGGLGELRLSDQDILEEANVTPNEAGTTYFDVSAYVHSTPEPASLVLLGIAAVVGLRLCRRFARMA